MYWDYVHDYFPSGGELGDDDWIGPGDGNSFALDELWSFCFVNELSGDRSSRVSIPPTWEEEEAIAILGAIAQDSARMKQRARSL